MSRESLYLVPNGVNRNQRLFIMVACPRILTYHWVREGFVRSARDIAEGPVCEFDASSSSSELLRPDLEALSIRGKRFEVKIGDLEKSHLAKETYETL